MVSLHLRRHVVWVLTGVVGLVCRCVLDLSIAITTAMICGHEATLRYVPRLRLISRLKHALFMWHSQTLHCRVGLSIGVPCIRREGLLEDQFNVAFATLFIFLVPPICINSRDSFAKECFDTPWVELSSFKTKAPANGQCIIGQFARLLME